eukprot:scaffold556_cov221-Pinguiococcus_pyrenoidosus.AAC.4
MSLVRFADARVGSPGYGAPHALQAAAAAAVVALIPHGLEPRQRGHRAASPPRDPSLRGQGFIFLPVRRRVDLSRCPQGLAHAVVGVEAETDGDHPPLHIAHHQEGRPRASPGRSARPPPQLRPLPPQTPRRLPRLTRRLRPPAQTSSHAGPRATGLRRAVESFPASPPSLPNRHRLRQLPRSSTTTNAEALSPPAGKTLVGVGAHADLPRRGPRDPLTAVDSAGSQPGPPRGLRRTSTPARAPGRRAPSWLRRRPAACTPARPW